MLCVKHQKSYLHISKGALLREQEGRLAPTYGAIVELYPIVDVTKGDLGKLHGIV